MIKLLAGPITALVLFLGLAACSDQAKLAPLPGHARLLAFGDSLTYGTGAVPDQSYPAHLARLTGLTVINAGVPGEISRQGLDRLPGVLDRERPDLLLLCHGGNDILRGLNKDAMQANLQAMIDLALQRNIAVVLIAVPQRSLLLRSEPRYRQLADANSIALEADVVAEVLAESHLRSDQIHPNAEGYKIMAEAVQRLLQKAGAL